MMASPALRRKRECRTLPLVYLIRDAKIIGIRVHSIPREYRIRSQGAGYAVIPRGPVTAPFDERAEFLRVSGGICNGGFEK